MIGVRSNLAAVDHARPARSRGKPQFQRSPPASSMKARSTPLAASRTAAAARGHPAPADDFVFSTVESAPPNRVFQGVRSGAGRAPTRVASGKARSWCPPEAEVPAFKPWSLWKSGRPNLSWDRVYPHAPFRPPPNRVRTPARRSPCSRRRTQIEACRIRFPPMSRHEADMHDWLLCAMNEKANHGLVKTSDGVRLSAATPPPLMTQASANAATVSKVRWRPHD